MGRLRHSWRRAYLRPFLRLNNLGPNSPPQKDNIGARDWVARPRRAALA